MKKKGFTLIELLAVIIILAVIALITTPIVLNVVDEAKKSAFRDSTYGLIDAIEYKSLESMINGNSRVSTYTFPSTDIKVQGSQPKGGTASVNKDGKVQIAVHNGKWCATKGYNDSQIIITDYVEGECGEVKGIQYNRTYSSFTYNYYTYQYNYTFYEDGTCVIYDADHFYTPATYEIIDEDSLKIYTPAKTIDMEISNGGTELRTESSQDSYVVLTLDGRPNKSVTTYYANQGYRFKTLSIYEDGTCATSQFGFESKPLCSIENNTITIEDGESSMVGTFNDSKTEVTFVDSYGNVSTLKIAEEIPYNKFYIDESGQNIIKINEDGTVDGYNIYLDGNFAYIYLSGLQYTDRVISYYGSVVAYVSVDGKIYDSSSNEYKPLTEQEETWLSITSEAGTSIINPTYSSDSTYILTGTTVDNRKLTSVTVNGTAATINEDGIWSISVNLYPEEYYENSVAIFNIEATDSNGNTTTTTRYICNGAMSLSVNRNNIALLDNYINDSEQFIIPSKIDGTDGNKYIITDFYDDALWSMPNIKSITIPETVSSIGAISHFKLEEVIVDENNQNYESLNGVVYDKGLTNLRYYPAAKKDASFVMPEGLGTFQTTEMIKYAVNLKSITLQSTISKYWIEYYDIENWDYIEEILVNENNQNLSSKDGVLYTKDMTELVYYPTAKPDTDFTIPSGVTKINEMAFERRENLNIKNLIIPGSLQIIDYGTFQDCKSLETVTILDGVTTINGDAFDGLENLKVITLPSTLTTIGERAFSECVNLTNIILPEGVQTIKQSAFSDCDSLITITIPSSVNTIGNTLFRNCDNLTSVTILANLETIDVGIFFECLNLKSVNVSSDNPNYTSEDGALYNKDKTILVYYPVAKEETSFTIPSTVGTIGKNAFKENKNLTSIIIPNNVTTIETSAFTYCENLASITIPSTVEAMTISTLFTGSYNLKEIIINEENPNYSSQDGVVYNKDKTILVYYPVAKEGTSFTIPSTVKTIQTNAFYDNINLTNVIVPSGVTTIGNYAFYNCKNLTTITLPDSVTSIGSDAFAYCENLTSITIPGNITTIKSYAFYGCDSLTDIVIPVSVTKIENNAFCNCKELKNVYYKGTETQWNNITKGSNNYYLTDATITYNYE